MSDIQSSIIQSLSKVLESAQSSYGPNGLGARTQAQSNAHAVVLTVVNVRDSLILLQDQASGKRIAVNNQALQGSATSTLNKGDTLTLVSSNEDTATFSLEKARVQLKQTAVSLGSQYRTTLAQTLATQWPDISPSTLRKIPPNVLNQVMLEAGSQNTQQVTKTLIEIANKSNQPLMPIKLDAKINQILANSVQLSISTLGQTSGSIKLSIALTPELNEKLVTGKSVSLEIDANNLKSLIKNISLEGKQSISTQSLGLINKALATGTEQTKQFLAQVLFSNKNTKASELVFVPTRDNLHLLNPSLKNALLADTSSALLKDARLIAAPLNAGSPNIKIELSLVAKPILVNIDAEQLAQASKKVDFLALAEIARSKSSPAYTATQVDLSQSGLSHRGSDKLNKSSFSVNNDNTPLKQDLLRTKLIDILSQPNTKSNAANLSIDAKTHAALNQLKALIAEEMNQTLPKSESMSKVLPGLVSQLQSMQLTAGAELKNLIANVLKQIENAQMTEGADGGEGGVDDDITVQQTSAASIKQMFTQAALPNITSQNFLAQAMQAIPGSQSQGSLVNGLITMLQASLQARLAAQQPNLLASIATLSSTFAQAGNNKTSKPNSTASKALQDLHKLDPRGNLIGELNKVLSNHSLHKLSAAESNLQGQDSFYYGLPNIFSPEHKDIEILIKREQHESQNENKKEAQQHWQLSMKLDIGDSGDVLAKVKLFQNQVDLNLYASNQALKEMILDYLPYLNRRLDALGLQVKPQCFLGKIPEKLYKTDYQVVQTYV